MYREQSAEVGHGIRSRGARLGKGRHSGLQLIVVCINVEDVLR